MELDLLGASTEEAGSGGCRGAANDVSLREMRNDARLRRMMRCLRQHSGRKPAVFDFIVFRQTNKSEFEGIKTVL